MSVVVAISGSPSSPSTEQALLSHVLRRVARAGHDVHAVAAGGSVRTGGEMDPEIAAQVSSTAAADAVVLVSPTDRARPPQVAEFLHLLPQFAFRDTPVLHFLVGDSAPDGTAALPTDSALRSALARLGAADAPGQFVPAHHLTVFADGGVIIDPTSALPVAEATNDFLAHLAHGEASLGSPSNGPVSPRAREPDLQVRRAAAGDPELQPLLNELMVEYGTRYSVASPNTELTEVPTSDFVAPQGVFLLLIENGETVAGGALRRYDDDTAEVKRVWTSSRHRRRGLGRRVMAELEAAAVDLGYARMHLTTGPRQPEARALYLATGYRPRFDTAGDPEKIGPLAFGKELLPGAGFVAWPPEAAAAVRTHPSADEVRHKVAHLLAKVGG